MRISVLLPVYNAEATVGEAVESILGQTETDFELVAVDDGSTDGTAEILADFVRRDARVHVITIERTGIVAALNRGLSKAQGRYIARMDADDVSYPERLAAQAGLLDMHADVGLVSCRVDYLGDREANLGLALYVDWTNTLLTADVIGLNRFVESPVIHPSVMFRREVVERHGGYRDGDFPEDYEMWLRWLEAGVRMEKIDRPLLGWRDRGGRLTRQDPRYSTEAFFRCKAPFLAEWLAANNPNHPKVIVWGAGRTTRRRLQPLVDQGIEISAYIDIDPKKIGWKVHGAKVLGPDQIPPPGEAFVLAAVGSRDARALIEAQLAQRGYEPGRYYLCIA